MRFSIIIPLYNKAPYVRKALESVCAQTYRDYELIVINDGSTDNSAIVAYDYLKATDGIDYKIINQPNAGVSAARNNGFSVSTAEYIAFLDADDWWEPTYLERMAQLINDHPDAGLYACNYVYYKPGKTHVALNIPTGYINYPKAYFESGVMPVTSITAILPRKVFDEMGGFPLGIKLGEDFLLWSKIALRYPVAFLNEPLAWYNNDVPVNLRATRNLHHPNNHMLFRLELAFGDGEECEVESVKCKGTEGEVKGKRLEAKGAEDEVKGERLKVKGTMDEVKGERLEVKGEENGKADTPASTPYTLHSTPTEAFTPYTLHLTPTEADWQALLDKLRINGLLEYWLDKRYHNLAAEELAKVDWEQQPNSVKRMYKTPIWFLKTKRMVMQVGSSVKQSVYRLKFKD